MSQPRNNLEAFNRQLSSGRGGGTSSGASADARPVVGKSKFKPANTGGNEAGTSQGTSGFKPVRPAPAAGVRKVGSLQTFSSPGFGKSKPAPASTSHSQPAEIPQVQARIPAINTPRAPPSASRFKPVSMSKSSPAPRISAGGTIDVSPSGSESSYPTPHTARKRQSGEVPLVPPAGGIKRLKMSPTPSERGSPVGEAEKENRYGRLDKGKERERLPGPSLGSSQTLVEVRNGLDNDDLRSKSVMELQHLAMYNMETVGQLKKDRKAFDFKIKTEQDVYLLDVFIRLAESRGQAIDEAIAQRMRGDEPKPTAESQPHPETQLLDDDDYDIQASPPPPLPPPRQANFSHGSDDYGSSFNPDDEADFEVIPPPRQQSFERRSASNAPPPPPPAPTHLPPMLELSPSPEPEPRDPSPEPEPEPEITEIMSDDELLWSSLDGPTTQDIDVDAGAFEYDDTDDIEVLDAPPIASGPSTSTLATPNSTLSTLASSAPSASFVDPANPSAFRGDPKTSTHYAEVMRVLRTRFKLQSFRPNQLETIIATLSGRDVFTLMPTGGGKSLCFQLPSLVSPGVTVVISPLIALMLDQTRELESLGIKCVWYNMQMTSQDRSNATQALLAPPHQKPNMVYMTPERLNGNDQMNNVLNTLYRAGLLSRFVIDEAHLLHTWGRNFRGSFMGLKGLRRNWPNVPIMALTATATPTAQEDIMEILGMRRDTLRLSQSFNRSNLRYTVLPKPRLLLKEIANFINGQHAGETGIVYCLGRDMCEKVAGTLAKEGISAKYFHAHMDPGDKERVFDAWKDGSVKVVVATVAFGMGINKADVRFVIHHDVPTSMANYLQETGRAGRDGLNSDCVLYYSYRDSQFHLKRNREEPDIDERERDRLNQDVRDIVEFATNTVDCRRVQLLSRFGEPFDPADCNKTCDNCQNSQGDIVHIDCSAAAGNMVRLLKEAEGRGIGKIPRGAVCAAFRGKTPKEVIERGMQRLDTFGVGKDTDMSLSERIFDKLMMLCVFAPYVEVAKYPATYVRLAEPKMYQPWLAGREKLEMRTRVAVGKGKKAAGGGKKKATVASKAELASDPIDDDFEEAPTRGLWQDDDGADGSYAPQADEPIAGPSTRNTRGKPASRRAPPPPEPEPEPEPEILEVRSPGAGEDWHDLCYKKLREVREQVCLTEGVMEHDDVLPDTCLQMLSFVLPADGAAFTGVLADELGGEAEANEKFRRYGRKFLDVCVTYSLRSQGRSVPPTPSSSAAPAPPAKRKFKPAISEPVLPTASQLHRAFDYQGTPKPPSGRGR